MGPRPLLRSPTVPWYCASLLKCGMRRGHRFTCHGALKHGQRSSNLQSVSIRSLAMLQRNNSDNLYWLGFRPPHASPPTRTREGPRALIRNRHTNAPAGRAVIKIGRSFEHEYKHVHPAYGHYNSCCYPLPLSRRLALLPDRSRPHRTFSGTSSPASARPLSTPLAVSLPASASCSRAQSAV